jgi:SAM-dependent methyltransferase
MKNEDLVFEQKGTKIVEIPYLEYGVSLCNKNSVLIIGERNGSEGIFSSVNKFNFKNIICTDIQPVVENSILWNNLGDSVQFVQGDFVNYDYKNKFDSIVCISVLEHFGMIYNDKKMFSGELQDSNDIILWNHDLRAITKMVSLLNDGGKAIIAIPYGRFMNYDENGFPWLRYYDSQRRKIILDLIKDNKSFVNNEKWYYSSDFNEWFESEEDILLSMHDGQINHYTPNCMWCFIIEKNYEHI